MRTFAQLDGTMIRWIFEAEHRPEFSSSIAVVDITDSPVEVKEGFYWDEVNRCVVDPRVLAWQESDPPVAEREISEEELAARKMLFLSVEEATACEIQAVVEVAMEAEWVDGTVGISSETNKNVRSVKEIYVTERFRYNARVREIVWGALAKYQARFGGATFRAFEPPHVLRYHETDEYKEHVDAWLGSPRKVTFILYLNADYDGGGLVFPRMGLRITPKPGLIVMFPSTFSNPHIAEPVVRGTKYAIATWAS